MKKGIHPDNYRPVVFKDMSNEDVFITRQSQLFLLYLSLVQLSMQKKQLRLTVLLIRW